MSIIRPFKAKAHLLKLLGDELIGDDRLAIFELVKNAYDADATSVDVHLELSSKVQKIIVMDHEGHGMSEEVILNKWMEVGTDSKRKGNRVRSLKFERMPLGEKGVGRLAVHKLGKELILNTRSEGGAEYRININWPNLLGDADYIEDTKVEIHKLDISEYFVEETGTRIEIRDLNNKEWSRGDIRRLKRLLTSLVSPFNSISDFSVNLYVPGREKDIHDVLDAEDVLDRAIWLYHFIIDEDGLFSYTCEYNPPSLFNELESEVDKEEKIYMELLPPTNAEAASRKIDNKDKLLLSKDDLNEIGPISGTFYIYLRDREVLNAIGAYQDIRTYLNEQTGIRIYRDGMRVFNYGEPNEDWLGLNAGRINRPGKKIGTNMVIGGIDLDLEKSYGLTEKTNREGFDENSCYNRFKWIIASAVDKFHILHRTHREDITNYIKKGRKNNKADPIFRFNTTVDEIKAGLEKHGLHKELGGKVDKIQEDYIQMRDVTLTTGVAGINLAVIFHEVERGIDELHLAIKNKESPKFLLKRSSHISKLLEGFAPLLKRNEQKTFTVKDIVERVVDLSKARFEYHNVILSSPLLIGESPDFEVKGPFGLLQATLSNLIDNSIHWTRLKSESESSESSEYKPAIRILTLDKWFKEGPALVVVDNGPGFNIEPDEAIKPFVTTRPAGMGVGLYYADMVMETIGGRLLITTADELELPSSYSGAAVVLIFKGRKD